MQFRCTVKKPRFAPHAHHPPPRADHATLRDGARGPPVRIRRTPLLPAATAGAPPRLRYRTERVRRLQSTDRQDPRVAPSLLSAQGGAGVREDLHGPHALGEIFGGEVERAADRSVRRPANIPRGERSTLRAAVFRRAQGVSRSFSSGHGADVSARLQYGAYEQLHGPARHAGLPPGPVSAVHRGTGLPRQPVDTDRRGIQPLHSTDRRLDAALPGRRPFHRSAPLLHLLPRGALLQKRFQSGEAHGGRGDGEGVAGGHGK
mmetsp:Transcript_26485/g.40971  ORF Transcript_26485/g.40971 Transcript_26485/m.40971 type:complete len:261 (+) Transcript_26485:26-808(+)